MITDHAQMTFVISDTFTDILARLTGEEQNGVKTTVFDLQLFDGLIAISPQIQKWRRCSSV
jgi:hypothetical protein